MKKANQFLKGKKSFIKVMLASARNKKLDASHYVVKRKLDSRPSNYIFVIVAFLCGCIFLLVLYPKNVQENRLIFDQKNV